MYLCLHVIFSMYVFSCLYRSPPRCTVAGTRPWPAQKETNYIKINVTKKRTIVVRAICVLLETDCVLCCISKLYFQKPAVFVRKDKRNGDPGLGRRPRVGSKSAGARPAAEGQAPYHTILYYSII